MFNLENNQIIDYLSWLSVYEFVFVSTPAKELPPYLALIRPCDSGTWISLIVTTTIMILALVFINWMTSNHDYMWKGYNF